LPKRPDVLYLADMAEATGEIAYFVSDLTEEAFIGAPDSRTRRAVLQCLIVLGEAAARLSQDLRDRHPQVDWRGVADMRNFVVHQYFGITWPIVWATATRNVPTLAAQIRDVLDQEGGTQFSG